MLRNLGTTVFPIPEKVIVMNGVLKQNPGY